MNARLGTLADFVACPGEVPRLDPTLLTIVVINYNGMDTLPRTLESIKAAVPDMSMVVVADDGSTDDSREWLRRTHPAVRIVGPERNSGRPTVVRNAGLRAVTTPFAFLTDNDLVFPPGSIAALFDALSQRESILCATPRLVSDRESTRIYADGGRLHFLALSAASARDLRVADRPAGEPFPTFGSGIMMIRMQHARAIGFFDEGFLHGWADDAEFQIRARLAGFESIHVPRVTMLHDTIEHGKKRALGQFANRYRIILTVYSGRSLVLLMPSLVTFELMSLVAGAVTGLALLQFRAIALTLRNLRDIVRRRRDYQRLRRVPDRELLVGGAFELPGAVAHGHIVGLASRAAAFVFDLNWKIARAWL
jgi:GT2 family glycosyltransferase